MDPLRHIIKDVISEAYGRDKMTSDDITRIVNAIWNSLDVEQLVDTIARSTVNIVNGSKNPRLARTRLENMVERSLSDQSRSIVSAIMSSL